MRVAVGFAVVLACAAPAWGLEIGRHRYDPHGKVKGVRALDLDGDGRGDLVLLVEPKERSAPPALLLLVSPATPEPTTFFAANDAVRIPADGALADAGAVALGRFGPAGEARLRFFGPSGAVDVAPDGTRTPLAPARLAATLLARSAGRPLVWWDGLADLDGDGRDECWVPTPEEGGTMQLVGGRPAQDRRLALGVPSEASTSPAHAFERKAYIPTLLAVDLDGDRRRELLALSGQRLLVWALAAAPGDETAPRPPLTPAREVPLPFLEPPEPLGPEEVRTPRLELADVDGDGLADLLLTLVTGRRDQLGGLRTTLYLFLGPFTDPATGALRAPEGRLDTESVTLHPRFVDVDGDGALDYVTDSIRGTRGDLLKRVLGAEPKITLVGFRFDRAARRFATEPLFSVERPYAAEEALSNRFGPSAWFDADLDGDGLADLLDLGNLTGVEVLSAARRPDGATGEPLRFIDPLVPRIPVAAGLSAGARFADLTADGRPEAVLWNDAELFVLTTRGRR